ncbi:MAG: homoserine kinase [Flavobacteriales bacterium CG_4_9_14_0_2_um_filter_35_242]|nr:homoserine kinase [Zetaproteobacteria bacterium]OIO09547.1 MAG: homoserine kinase [Flavobacteriaceae bacterium CG1_02_35_72]PIR13215.1 MAG: homoserine kinase [Flavobacteriales bacterium CG11_big_fil_rev_8_21_14_0_20_35_7]PIV16346.1 MAG: homoserine kinase [Flavobacteriales bacterium CG03_land_8_20_14_0_80_35_15]PIX06532.1 MAG: homoserine kinase [Flavobacteriales bacterium CG_4_8_14_3_um_filter_35_10]PJA05713.1 MAG: homoserine kinase [Flavobacteriales bacterium CG_4_10_14_0_2_um_filter_35_18]
MKTIRAFAPATIANINVGFDVLGLALNELGDTVELIDNHSDKNKIIEIKNGANLPFEVDENCCSVVIKKMQEALNNFKGVDIKIVKGFAAGSGLGSSSASSAAAAFAYNSYLGKPFKSEELIAFAAEGERVACGAAHTDNVAPALLGGIVLSKGKNPKDYIKLPVLEGLYVVTLFPNIKVKTSDSRKLLKETIPMTTVSRQVALMGAFVVSLYQNDFDLFSASLHDLIVEPMRKLLIPKFDELKQTALDNKALAFGISGSGPSVFAFARDEATAISIKNALEKVYENTGIITESYINKLSEKSGAKII